MNASHLGLMLFLGLSDCVSEPLVNVADVQMFPRYQQIMNEDLKRGKQQRWLFTMSELYPQHESLLCQWTMELVDLEEQLNTLRWCLIDWRSDEQRISDLRKYRKLVGYERYYSGWYPRGVPDHQAHHPESFER